MTPRKQLILLCFLTLSGGFFLPAQNGHAQITLGDRTNPDFVRPNQNDGKTFPGRNDEWKPESWTESRGKPEAVIDGFYQGNLILRQYMDDKIPVVEVGDNFMKLSPRDQERVAAYIDQTYGYTKSTGMFYLYYPVSKKPFAVYDSSGLTLQ